MYKRNFRALRAKKLMGLINEDHEDLIHKAVKMIKKKDIVKCVNLSLIHI